MRLFRKPSQPTEALLAMMMAGVYDEIQKMQQQAKKDKQEILEALNEHWANTQANKG